MRQAVLNRGVKLVVADPRKIELCEFATLHLQQKPGTDIALVNGLMYIILEKGYEDKQFIEERTENFDALVENVKQYPPEKVSKITGIPVDQLYEAVEIIVQNAPMAVFWAMGITQHTVGVHNVFSLADLQLMLGNFGKPGAGVNPLRGQNNVQGACDMGCLVNVYPGYQAVTAEASQQKFEAAWGTTLSNKVGKTVTEIIPGVLEGTTKALYILGENPMMTDPDTNHIRHCLEELDFLALQEIFPLKLQNMPMSSCPVSLLLRKLAPSPALKDVCKWCVRPSPPAVNQDQIGKLLPILQNASSLLAGVISTLLLLRPGIMLIRARSWLK
jgi:predicted molibdopterin-dependent oxidoreductase YjgC